MSIIISTLLVSMSISSLLILGACIHAAQISRLEEEQCQFGENPYPISVNLSELLIQFDDLGRFCRRTHGGHHGNQPSENGIKSL